MTNLSFPARAISPWRAFVFLTTFVLAAAVALTIGAGTARAAITFDGSPGTAAPPGTLGPYTMTPFPADPQPLFTNVSSVAAPTGGSVGFSPSLNHRRIGLGWATWSHGYTGDVYYTNGGTSATMTMPANTVAFYFYAEPNPFGFFDITATAQDGTTSGPIPVDGFAGATYFGFYATGGDTIVSITVGSTVDFAIGEFGIAVNRPPDCSTATASPDTLWPPNHKFRTVTVGGVTDPDGDPVTITIDGVTQDEPINGLGDGDKSPDAALGPTSDSVLIRAERSGLGDGRVYEISFTATDDKGATCTGTVTVSVPKSRNGDPAVDSGQLYDSFGP
jgi:hypothetical protein